MVQAREWKGSQQTTTKWAEETKKAKQGLGIDEGDMEREKNICEAQSKQQIKSGSRKE